MTSVLFDIPPADPLTFLAVSALLAAVALAAALIPARRAAAVDPMRALREF
jgi:ABC-type lipoprotein release transport system permease subunit